MKRDNMIRTGALLAGLAVAAGAFGAHILENRLSENDLQIFETAVRYLVFTGQRWFGAITPIGGVLLLLGWLALLASARGGRSQGE